MKTVSICQPHFIPWLGYFRMIKNSDKFIFLDDVQYNRRSWQNRVHIRSSINANDKKYLSLSVKENSRSKKIKEVFLHEHNITNINNQIINSYQSSKNFKKIKNFLMNFFEKNIKKDLASINIGLITEICKILNIELTYDLSSNLNVNNKKKENLILEILKQEEAKIYLSNLGSKNYVDEIFFQKNNIKLIYNQFFHPIYDQNTKIKLEFLPNLSVIDLLMNHNNPSEIFKNF